MDVAAAMVLWVETAMEQRSDPSWGWADVSGLVGGLHAAAESPPLLPSPALERGLRALLDLLPDLVMDVPKGPVLVPARLQPRPKPASVHRLSPDASVGYEFAPSSSALYG